MRDEKLQLAELPRRNTEFTENTSGRSPRNHSTARAENAEKIERRGDRTSGVKRLAFAAWQAPQE
jgi:hypothetical protein